MDSRLVALALAVALAGCGSVGGNIGPATERATLTPAPVPEPAETAVPLPPGVTGDRVRDPEALLAAHWSVLEGRSYTLRVRVRVGNSAFRRVLRQEHAERYYTRDVLPGSRGNVTEFADGESTYTRSNETGSTRYERLADVRPPDSQGVQQSVAFFRPEGVSVARTTVDGRPAFVVSGTRLDYPDANGYRNFTLRAVVEPTGLVRSLNVSYVRTAGSRPTPVTHSFVYTDVGSTDVERPAWVDREFNDTGE